MLSHLTAAATLHHWHSESRTGTIILFAPVVYTGLSILFLRESEVFERKFDFTENFFNFSFIIMVVLVRRAVFLLLALGLVPELLAISYNDEPEVGLYGEDVPDSYETNERFNRHIHSMINAYRNDILNERMVIETNSLVDTKYKAWKRNADLINSLLALPKGLNDAGR